MIDRKELEILVRAQIKGGKDLDSVAKSIANIGVAITEQSEAAKRGESRIDELKASLESLSLIQKELQGQSSAVSYFQRLGESIAKSEDRVKKATDRYTAYNKKLEEAGTRTEQQQQTLIKYSVAVERANKSLDSQRATLASMEAEFRSAGVAVENLAAVQQRNLTLQAELGLVYNQGKESIKEYAAEVRKARAAQAELDKANAESVKNAELFEKAERKAAEASAARARAAEEVAASRDQRQAESAMNRRIAKEEEDQLRRGRELAALRRDIVDRSATQALVDQADAATKTARSYTTLARAADTLRPKSVSLRDSISQIIAPASQARATLGGLEGEVTKLAASVDSIKRPVQDYRGQMDQLLAAQKAVSQQAGLVDTFNRQVIALREARTAFVAARADVASYAAKVAEGGEAGAQFAAKLAQAQSQLRGSAQALAQQVQATRDSREALRGAGIASSDLAAAQQRLNGVARQTVTTMGALEAATQKYGVAVDKSKQAKIGFRDEGRTTLSYLQRLRGEVLSLIAAYGGLFTVINTARGAVQASQAREGARNQLGISVGNDRKAIDAEYEYVKGQADRIGIEFERAIKGYAKFSAAATLAGRDRKEIRYIFETFSEVARVANLSADDLDGVFKALEQITSKGKIQAEELRGQLGDRLFGAFEIAAKALKDQFPDLDKALKNGEVTAKQLVLIAEQYRKTVADQLPAATKSLAAQQARLNNELFFFKLAVGDSGFIESYSDALEKLTKFLRSEDGAKFAASIGAAFKGLTDIFIFLLDNINTITLGLKLFFTYFVYTRFASGLKGMSETVKSFGDLRSAIVGVGSEMTKLQKGFALVAAFMAGWQIGTWAYKEFAIVRDAGTWLVTSMLQAWAVIKASYQAAFELFPEIAKRVWAKVVETISSGVRKMLGIFASFARSAGFDGLADTLEGTAKRIEVGSRENVDVVSTYRQNLEKELAGIRKIRDEMLADNKLPAGATTRSVAQPTPSPGLSGGKGKTGPTEAEIRKRENEIEAITKALEALDSKIDRSQTETLAKQLEAIDSQYAGLARRIEKLGGDTGKAFMTRLTSTIQELRDVTIKKFNDDLKKETDAFLKKTGDAEEQAGKRQRLDLQARLGAITSDYEQLYKELADLREKFVLNNRDTGQLEDARLRLNAAKELRLEQETIKFNTEELNRRETLLNDTIAARDKLLAAVNTQKEVGTITDVDAAQRLNDIQDQYLPKINAAAEATRLWAIENAKIFATDEQRQVFLATLDAIQAKATNVKTEFSLMNQSIISGSVKAVDTGLNAVVDGLQNVANGQASVGEGFRGMLVGFAQFAASFLRDIALMIIKLQIFRAMQGSGNAIVAAAGTAGLGSMGVKHDGGLIGHYNNGNRVRSNVAPTWGDAIPRYHTGGVAGLASDEYLTILKKNEEVLTQDSPRNIMNAGAAGVTAAPAADGAGMRFVLVDERSRVTEAMNSPDGERVVMMHLKKNITTLKQYVNGGR